MPGLVDCGVVLRTVLPSDNAFFTSFDQSLQGTVYFFDHNHTCVLINISALRVQFGIQAFPEFKRT